MDDAERLLEALRARGLTLATAESCTGGMVGAALTAIPGSSDSYRGGVISYCNEVKHGILGVPQELLDRYDAVSWQVAEAMAAGARRVCGAEIGIGITGIAGPGGDGTGKPVGLVYVGYCGGEGASHLELHLKGGRAAVREQARDAALRLVLEKLK